MGYGNDASSSNLKPILLVVSLLTMVLFGAMYGSYVSCQTRANTENSLPAVISVQAKGNASVSQSLEKKVAVKPRLRSRV